jgi:hypothetical protein
MRDCVAAAAILIAVASARADDIVPSLADSAFGGGKQADVAKAGVVQTAYAGLSIGETPPPPPTPSSASVMTAPTFDPPPPTAVAGPLPLAPGEVVYSPAAADWNCAAPALCRTSSWTAGIEFIPLESNLTDGRFERWTDDGELALRFVLGYEDPRGYGLRGRFFGLSQEASPDFGDVTMELGNFDLDFYKRILFADRSELAVGFGGSSGVIRFELDDRTRSEFEGGGVSVFAEGFLPALEFEHSDLGIVGRARYTMLMGDWRDDTFVVIPPTDNDTLSVVELAWGIEFRRRFGRFDDHHWYLGAMFEYQRWQSDWMSNFTGTSIGLSGVNLNTGLVW